MVLSFSKRDYRSIQSVFIPERLIRKYGPKTGHLIHSDPLIRKNPLARLFFRLMKDGKTSEEATGIPFTELTPYYPLQNVSRNPP